MSKCDFVDWWLETDYGRKKHIRWDGRHQSKCWKHFDQVAQIKTREPKVMCKRCLKTLIHPQISRQGTSTMNKHTSGVNCQNVAGSAGKQKGIKDAMRNAVSTTPKQTSAKLRLILCLYRHNRLRGILECSTKKLRKRKSLDLSLCHAFPSGLSSTLISMPLLISHAFPRHA